MNNSFPIYPQSGVLMTMADPSKVKAISGAVTSPKMQKLTATMQDGSTVDYPLDSLTPDQKTGRISFSSNSSQYGIRELREEDGSWMSKYKTSLPVEALQQLITPPTNLTAAAAKTAPAAPNTGAPKGDDPDFSDQESLVAYASDESVYVLGVVYTNASGRWSRTDGDWILMPPDDTIFQNMQSIYIDPSQADKFLELYDNNHVTVTDAAEYEDPQSSYGATEDANGDD